MKAKIYQLRKWLSVPVLLAGVLLCCGLSHAAGSGNIVTPRLKAFLDQVDNELTVKVWVYFVDKPASPESYAKVSAEMSLRALRRRVDIPPDWYDLPVNEDYIERVRLAGGRDLRASRWLNAVSARLTKSQIEEIASEAFVRRIDRVAVMKRAPEPDSPMYEKKAGFDTTAYGSSFIQNTMIKTDSLHRLGLSGAGVLLAFLDTGYRIDHPAFDSLTVTDTWDFINGDADVTDDVILSQTDHGTATLSACGGFGDGDLIGPAYAADYALYKTELKNQEIEIEEDYWVLAAERADSIGADIISSSLGYLDWYEYADMDGNTAVTTIAADIAASRGILVVISAGNEGDIAWRYINAPADGDSVIAVGAVDVNGIIASFSSFGPTFDGRVKPEVVAMGVSTRCASYLGGYTYKSGTSLSAPLIAGGAALILQANPSLRGNPMEVRRRIIESANRYDAPDDRYGYGLPDFVTAGNYGLKIQPLPVITVSVGQEVEVTVTALAPIDSAVHFEGVDLPATITLTDLGDGTATLRVYGDEMYEGGYTWHIAARAGALTDTLEIKVITNAPAISFYYGPNPFHDSLTFFMSESLPGIYTIDIFSLSGELVHRIEGNINPVTWYGVNEAGEKVAAGVYIIRISADGIEEKVKVMKL